MVVSIVLFCITVVGLIISVLFKPYIKIGKVKIGLYWIITLLGAILFIIFGQISFPEIGSGLVENSAVNPLKILALFLSMTLISEFLGDAGFFKYAANKVFNKNPKNLRGLFIILYLVVAVLTVFTSNDIIVLTFTPCICIFAKKAKVSPIPFLFGEFVAANTWSMALIIGNPTNIYLASAANINFFNYLSYMWLPALFSGIVSLAFLLLIFNKQLTAKKPEVNIGDYEEVKTEKVPLIVALAVLIICIVLLAVASFINVEMWLICLISAGVLILFNLVYGIVKEKSGKRILRVLKKEPYELIPFVLSMFIIVLALYKSGITETIGKALIRGDKVDGITFGFLSGVASNLLNNIPMSVLFEKIIAGRSLSATFGAVIGSNIGAFITPVGALAGIMWNKILAENEVKFSFLKFCGYGTLIAIPTLGAATLGLYILL